MAKSSAISIATSARVVRAGSSYRLSGTARSGSTALKGNAVHLYSRVPGAGWVRAKSTNTNAAGRYAFTLTASSSGHDYVVKFGGVSKRYLPAQSAVVRQSVTFTVGGIRSIANPLKARSVGTVRGWTDRALAGRRVFVQHSTRKGWLSDGTSVVGANGIFSMRFRTGAAANVTYRLLVIPNPAKYVVGSVSGYRHIGVR